MTSSDLSLGTEAAAACRKVITQSNTSDVIATLDKIDFLEYLSIKISDGSRNF